MAKLELDPGYSAAMISGLKTAVDKHAWGKLETGKTSGFCLKGRRLELLDIMCNLQNGQAHNTI